MQIKDTTFAFHHWGSVVGDSYAAAEVMSSHPVTEHSASSGLEVTIDRDIPYRRLQGAKMKSTCTTDMR